MTSILSAVAGIINNQEVNISADINCNPVDPAAVGADLFGVPSYQVLSPSGSGDLVPFNGGSIVRVSGNNGFKIGVEKNGTQMASYLSKIEAMKNIAEQSLSQVVGGEISFDGYRSMSRVRTSINECMLKLSNYISGMQNDKDIYRENNVPEFTLSNKYVPEEGTVWTDTTDSYNNYLRTLTTEDKDLKSFSFLSFIPFEVILHIFKLLSEISSDGTTGLGLFSENLLTIGSSRLTYKNIYDALLNLSSSPWIVDAVITAALIELFPVIRLSEDSLFADTMSLAGYYTFIESTSSFYIKFPNLTGKDSRESYSDFVYIDNDGQKSLLQIVLNISLSQNSLSKALAFKYVQIPNLEVKNTTIDYLEGDSNQQNKFITVEKIQKVPYGHLNDYSFKLSPLLDCSIKNNNILNTITKLNQSCNGLAINKDQLIEAFPIPVDINFKYFKDYNEKAEALFSQYNSIPLHQSSSKSLAKVDSLDSFLSAINRPEIILSDRENDLSTDQTDKNDLALYSASNQYSRIALSGSKPEYLFKIKDINSYPISSSLDELSFPKHWLPLSSQEDDESINLSLSSEALDKLKTIYSLESETDNGIINLNDVQFALYIIHNATGQFLRLPGPNITFNIARSSITQIIPDGFYGGTSITPSKNLSFSIIGENLKNAEAVYIVLPTGDRQIINNTESGFIASNDKISILSTKLWSSVLTLLGKFDVYVTTKKTANKRTNTKQILISQDGIADVDLERNINTALTFTSLNSIYSSVEGKPKSLADTAVNNKGPDSIPLSFDGVSNIGVALNSKDNYVFGDSSKGRLFCYLATKDKAIIESVGLDSDVTKVTVSGEDYYFNKKLEWSYGDEHFKKADIGNAVYIKFPGPAKNTPINLTQFIETSGAHISYLIFSNEKITSDKTINISSGSTNFPVSILQLGKTQEDKPAFITPPHILGLFAEIDREHGGAADFNIGEAYSKTDSLFLKIKNAIPNGMLSEDSIKKIRAEAPISSNDKLKYLMVLFKAPNRRSRSLDKTHSFYIENNKINKFKIKKIKYLEQNVAVAFFKNIDNLPKIGYSEVRVVRSNLEHSGSCSSDLYTKVSKKIKSDFTISNDIASISSEFSRELGAYNAYNQNKLIKTQAIIPVNTKTGDTKYSGLLQYFGYLLSPGTTSGWAANDGLAEYSTKLPPYIRFSNPVVINTDVTLTVGSNGASSYGAVLSDQKIEDGRVKEDCVELSSGKINPIVTRDYANKKAEANKAESKQKIENITNSNKSTADDPASTQEEKDKAAESDAIIVDVASLQSQLDDLLANVNSASAAIMAKIEQINELLRKASAITDKLSSGVFAAVESIEQLIGNASRPLDVISFSQYKCLIQESIPVNSAYSAISSDGSELFVTVTTHIAKAHSIKQRIPEILKIVVDGQTYTSDNYRDLKIGSNPIVIDIYVKDGDADLKVELSKFRVSSTFIERNPDGTFLYRATINPSDRIQLFETNDCIKLSISTTNKDRLKISRTIDPTYGQDVERAMERAKSGVDKLRKKSKKKIDDKIKQAKLKVGPWITDKALAAQDFIRSFCDFSFHLTAEIAFQLKALRIIYVPIKVIFCIIDVLCALTNPVKLALAIIRLFVCLFDLLLLLPQLALPVLFLTLLIHILELLLCVIQKIITIVVATNEIIDALERAIKEKSFEAIKNLEITLEEHLITIEADLQVMEPILQIIGLIQELLQLAFAFPCQVNQDPDDPGCIDPSMLAGLIVGKVAPNGQLVPDAMIPMAQTYTNLSSERVGSEGNTPDSSSHDPESVTDIDYNSPPKNESGNKINNVLYKTSEAVDLNTDLIVIDNSNYAGNTLPALIDSQTQEPKTVQPGGYFSGDSDGDGLIDNINYEKLRFKGGDFNATFTMSCTKAKKKFSFGIPFLNPKNDPRFVEFSFNNKGLTNNLLFTSFASFFNLKGKVIDENFPLDSNPAFLASSGSNLKIYSQSSSSFNADKIKLVSPIDGFSDFIEYVGSDSNLIGDTTYSFKPKPLIANIDVYESGVDPVTGEATVTSRQVTKTFGGIPSFAIVDDRFNVYFVEDGGLNIRLEQTESGSYVPVIDTIFAKMINFPAATSRSFDKEEESVTRKTNAYVSENKKIRSNIVKDLLDYSGGDVVKSSRSAGYENDLGDALLKLQANASFFQSLTATQYIEINDNGGEDIVDRDTDETLFGSSKPFFVSGPNGGPYTIYINYNKLNDKLFNSGSIGSSGNYVGKNGASKLKTYLNTFLPDNPIQAEPPYPDYGVYEFVNGTILETDDLRYAVANIDVFVFPQIYFVDLRQVADDIAAACGTSQANQLLLDMPGFTLDFNGDVVEPYSRCLDDFIGFFLDEDKGIVSKARNVMANGGVPEKISIPDIKTLYDSFVACTNLAIDDSCKFTINPLNTTFKLLDDKDETPLDDYIDPTTTITEVELAGAVATMPTITGAMEYASGIGDSVTVSAGSRAIIQIIPRDSYDDQIIDTLDLRKKIRIDILSDSTSSGAELVKMNNDQDTLFNKDGSVYTVAIKSSTPGKVTIKASICDVTIQAVTERGIKVETVEEGCIPNVTDTAPDLFAPGSLIKVDRILTILFVAPKTLNIFESNNEGASVTLPQVEFTNMVN
jgi:hypothetical protein